MKEAIGNASIFGLAIGFIGIIALVFLSSLNYTKAFKVKNRMIDIIEQYNDGYSLTIDSNGKTNRQKIEEEIEDVLMRIGYRVNRGNKTCPDRNGARALNSTYNYHYCIYEYESTRGTYYAAVSYMYLDIPLIGEFLEFPVSGETKVFYHVVDIHGK